MKQVPGRQVVPLSRFPFNSMHLLLLFERGHIQVSFLVECTSLIPFHTTQFTIMSLLLLSTSLASQITSFQSFLGSLSLFRRECTKSTLPSPMTIQGLCTFQTHAASFMSFNFVSSDRLHTFFFYSRREEIITKTVSRLENFPKNQVTRTELNSPVNFIIPLTILSFGTVVPKIFNERNEGNGL